jgi:hypothetical protein
MRPQNDLYAVRRESNGRALDWGLILPDCDLGLAYQGTITAVGERTAECVRGSRVLYSTRIDSYRLSGGAFIDLVSEKSIIGILDGHG